MEAIISAYHAVASDQGYPEVALFDLAREAGVSLEAAAKIVSRCPRLELVRDPAEGAVYVTERR